MWRRAALAVIQRNYESEIHRFSNWHASALRQLPADQGARNVISASSGTLQWIETKEHGVIVDVDSIDDVQSR
ncbi:MAG: hypothetical protein ABF290_06415 [Thiogranum sp.]